MNRVSTSTDRMFLEFPFFRDLSLFSFNLQGVSEIPDTLKIVKIKLKEINGYDSSTPNYNTLLDLCLSKFTKEVPLGNSPYIKIPLTVYKTFRTSYYNGCLQDLHQNNNFGRFFNFHRLHDTLY